MRPRTCLWGKQWNPISLFCIRQHPPPCANPAVSIYSGMLTERRANQLGIGATLVMFGLLLLVGFRVVPPTWELPLFILAVALFAGRLIMRVVLRRRKAVAEPPMEAPPGPDQQ